MNRRSCRGFVFMDTLVALALLVTGVFVTIAFFRAEVRELRGTHERMAAQLIAESEVERLHTLSYSRIAVGENQPLELNLPSARQLRDIVGTLTVREVEPGLKSAVVRVQWSSPQGRVFHVEQWQFLSAEGAGQ